LTSKKRYCEAVKLTRDHKPNLKDERARITKSGGQVIFDGQCYRACALNAHTGLGMSRSLGDLSGHLSYGLSCEPELSERIVNPLDHVLILCSDGVWDHITPQEAVDIVCQFPGHKASAAADRLASEAWDRFVKNEEGFIDDITVVLCYLAHDDQQLSDEKR